MKRSDKDVPRNPQPSLLRSLMTEHLDPGYSAAARARASGKLRNKPTANALWFVAGIALISFVITAAYAHTLERVPGTEQVRADLLTKVGEAQSGVDHLTTDRNLLATDVDARSLTVGPCVSACG